jgi:nitrogen fixation NifU-like protein
MSQLDELYQTLILEHNRHPRNFGKLETATGHAEGRNPLCGDAFDVWLRLEGDTIAEVSFLGQGCAISKASASMMTAAIKGKTVAEAEQLFDRFHRVVTGQDHAEPGAPQDRKTLGNLSAFAGVSAYPTRVKCATLAWHALKQALIAEHPNNRKEPKSVSGE